MAVAASVHSQPDLTDQSEAETDERGHSVDHREGVPQTEEQHTAISTLPEAPSSITPRVNNAVLEKQKQTRHGGACRVFKSGAGALWQKVKRPFQALNRWIQTAVWFWEIFSRIAASVALAAIYLGLAIHEYKTLPHWPFKITINALIAVFTAVLKATIILPIAEGLSELKWMWFFTSRPVIDMDRFDRASRGPWGSFLLFFLSNTNGSTHAVGGAWRRFLSPCLSFFTSIRLQTYLGALITVVALAIHPFSQ